MAREHPQSEGGCNSTALNVGIAIVGKMLRIRERGSSDACAVAREHPQSEGGSHSTSLNASYGVIRDTPIHQESDSPDVCKVADSSPGDESELRNSAPDFNNDIISCIVHAKVDKAKHLRGPDISPSLRSACLFSVAAATPNGG